MTTEQGRSLTRQHRGAQIRNTGRAIALSRTAWDALDVRDLDASMERWLRAQLPILRTFNLESARLAEGYLNAFRQAEIGGTAPTVPAGFIDEVTAVASLRITGPVAAKRAIAQGLTPGMAMDRARRQAEGAITRLVAQGGRGTVDATVRSDGQAQGWARITGPNPCAWCAMLASRGPVYASRDVASGAGVGGRVRGSRTGGEAYHDHCQCAAEPSYGNWTPPPSTVRWEELYTESIVPGDMKATLNNMRRVLEGRDH